MGKNNKAHSKAAEKKKERLDMERKMRPRIALVKAANAVDDPMENLPSFQVLLHFCFVSFFAAYFSIFFYRNSAKVI